MPATRLLWGQIIAVLLIALVAVWAATQWTAWRLGFQPQLGAPWFQMWPGISIHHPQAFFWTSTAPMRPGSFSRARGANV